MDNQKFKPKFKRFSKCLRVQPRTRVAVLASASRRPATPEPLGGGPGVGRDAHTWASVFSNIFLSVYSKSTFNTLKHLRNRAQHPNAYVTNMQSSTETWAAGAELPRSPERWSRNEASLRGGFTIFLCVNEISRVSPIQGLGLHAPARDLGLPDCPQPRSSAAGRRACGIPRRQGALCPHTTHRSRPDAPWAAGQGRYGAAFPRGKSARHLFKTGYRVHFNFDDTLTNEGRTTIEPESKVTKVL